MVERRASFDISGLKPNGAPCLVLERNHGQRKGKDGSFRSCKKFFIHIICIEDSSMREMPLWLSQT